MRVFGLEEARQLLPFVRAAFERVHACLEQAHAAAGRLEQGGLTPAEAQQVEEGMHRLAQQVHEELEQLEQLGVEVKAVEGLVDFRAQLAGRQVYLCWRYPEEALEHWHELDAGLAGRRPIEDPQAFGRSYPS